MQCPSDDSDIIEKFEAQGHGRVLGEITLKQVQLYSAPGVNPSSYSLREWRIQPAKKIVELPAMLWIWQIPHFLDYRCSRH